MPLSMNIEKFTVPNLQYYTIFVKLIKCSVSMHLGSFVVLHTPVYADRAGGTGDTALMVSQLLDTPIFFECSRSVFNEEFKICFFNFPDWLFIKSI